MIDPTSFKEQAEKSSDIVLKDLYEISSSSKIVEITSNSEYNYKDNDGNIKTKGFPTPIDTDTKDDRQSEELSKKWGYPIGRSVSGNLGRTLVPSDNSPTGANSTNSNIQVIINSTGSLNHRAIGVAHELVHVLLYLRSGGTIFRHQDKGVDAEIEKRATIVSKRLGYDY